MENIAIKEHFNNLVKEQIERNERIKNQSHKTDFSKKDKIVIGLVNGDGIGPIIVNEAKRVIDKLLKNEIEKGKIEIKEISGLTIENRIKLNKSVPDNVLSELKSCDVILKGPTTTPHGGTLESANVTLRRELDLFANVRPVKIPEKNIDWTFFRENSEGEYVLGSKGMDITPDMAIDFKITTVAGTRRIAKAAFDYAKNNGKKRVAIVTKANIIKHTDGMFSSVCHEVSKEYPEIEVSDWYVDIMAANLINKSIRNSFEVFLLPNLYGDIITDEAAQVQGGVGTAGSANIGDRYAMFEAIHGSAPRMIEEGHSEYANPESILRALVMLLEHIVYTDKAKALQNAIIKAEEISNMTGEKGGNTAKEFTDNLLKFI
ncbi:MAG: isocitrate/isopropylmalate dehydrogenase family protein [Clostridia bacterium]|nr:isocitrate/isopropylmalate dehydrogenase family protein [Clostridia bacterium]